jgi:hypothetical protein
MKQRLCYLLLCTILNTANVSARSGGVSGRIVNESGSPVTFASVMLLKAADSSLIRTELTDQKGAYLLTPAPAGLLLIKVSLIGYKTFVSAPASVSDNTVSIPDITLLRDDKELKEVAITAQKPFIEIHPDKVVVNVENSIVSAGSSVLDILSRSPGVTVDNNDNISLKGKQGVNVMINGKIQPMSGQDLANMLKSMPSNAVENIELITNPSAKYDAAGTAGIINIVLKKDKKMGLNGSANATYAQGIYGKANGGVNLNYRNKKFNFFANYNHSIRLGFNHLTLDRKFFASDVLGNPIFAGAYEQDNNYLYHITSDMGGAGMDYNISAKTVVGMALSDSYTDFRRDGYNYSNIRDSATQQVLSHFTTDNSSPNNCGNYTANVNFRHTFDTSGRSLAIDADYAGYPSRGLQDYTTAYFINNPDGSFTPSPTSLPVIFHGDITGLTQIRSFKADYVVPLKSNAKFEAGIKSSFVTADNDLRFSNLENGVYVPDNGRTNHFIYNENINAGYVNLSKDGTKWSTHFGLRAEQTAATGDAKSPDTASTFSRNYTQLFPSLALQRHIDPQNDLGLTLSRRIERPNYEQLNPSPYYLDPTTYKAGYPYLNPALSYSSELSYTYKQKFITTLGYSRTSAPIVEVIQPSTTEQKVTIQTEKNLTAMEFFGISGSYQFQFAKWWNNTTNVNVYYARYTGDIAGTDLNAGKVTFDVNTTNSFILGHNWSAEVGGFYQAPQVYGYMHLKPSWMLNLGIQKNFLDKRATVRLNATDIFWHGYPRATSYYNDYVESSMSFTWRFGKRTIPASTRHEGGAEEEKKRAGGQAG